MMRLRSTSLFVVLICSPRLRRPTPSARGWCGPMLKRCCTITLAWQRVGGHS